MRSIPLDTISNAVNSNNDDIPSRGSRSAILLIGFVTLVTFWGAVRNQFVAWDDDQLILANDHFREISVQSLRWMFTTTLGGHYQPLTWLSYAVETEFLWGVNAAGFHFTNLLLHLLATAGFLFVAKSLLEVTADRPQSPLAKGGPQGVSGPLLGATFAALLFAVHPLRVESVVWATERRDVLSGAFLVWCVWCYLQSKASTSTGKHWLAVSLGLYLLSLLSKAGGITLPIVLLILDVYPLRRRLTRALLVEKAVYLIPAIVFASAAIWAQRQAGALRTFEEHPFSLRVAQAAYGVMFYLGKTLWPADLVPLYEQRPDATPTEPIFIVCALAAAAVTVIAWKTRKRIPAVLAAWAVYLVLLSPVLGFAQSGPQVVADRYSYLPAMALMTLLGGALATACGIPTTTRTRRGILVAPSAALVLACAISTRAQVGIWKDSLTLWRTTLARAPNTPTVRANLAVELNRRGEFAEARTQAEAALEVLPGNRAAHAALAHAAFELGDLETAEQHGWIAMAIADHIGRPDLPTMIGMVAVLTLQDRLEEAEELRRRIVELDPSLASFRFDPSKYKNRSGVPNPP